MYIYVYIYIYIYVHTHTHTNMRALVNMSTISGSLKQIIPGTRGSWAIACREPQDTQAPVSSWII